MYLQVQESPLFRSDSHTQPHSLYLFRNLAIISLFLGSWQLKAIQVKGKLMCDHALLSYLSSYWGENLVHCAMYWKQSRLRESFCTGHVLLSNLCANYPTPVGSSTWEDSSSFSLRFCSKGRLVNRSGQTF